jgi:hypothetical protein
MTKLGIGVGILAMLFCFSGSAQTINIIALDQDGVQTILQAAKESALQRNAPSAIAVVDHAVGCFRAHGCCASRKRGPCHREGTNGREAATADGGDRGEH